MSVITAIKSAVKKLPGLREIVSERDRLHSELVAVKRNLRLDSVAFQAAAEVLLARLDPALPPFQQFGGVSDEFWFWLSTEGCRRHPKLRAYLPGMPPDNVQLQFTGDCGDAVLLEGWEAYRLFREFYERYVGPLDASCRVLDFGCGWGRIIRFFLKELAPESLVGIDPVSDVVELSRRGNRWCRFEVSPQEPPTRFDSGSFDFIYSFSVFSHLSEAMAKTLLGELARLLKPGGLMALTTRSRAFIPYCAELRADPGKAPNHPEPQSSARAFLDTSATLKAYDAGQYCFHSFNYSGEWSYWGETAIPRRYVEREWTKELKLAEFFHNASRPISQAVIVLKKDKA